MSTIFADNFKNTSGGDPVNINEVKTDKITGKTAAGSITVQGEGTNTTNLQQGLSKQFCHLNMSSASVDDSFNNSSITDSNTGNFRYAYTNNMANLGYTIALQTLYVQAWGNVCNIPTDGGNTTTQTSGGGIYSVNLHTNGNATDTTEGHISVTGDLA